MINGLCFEMSKRRDNQILQIAGQQGEMAGQSRESLEFGEREATIPLTKSVKSNPSQRKTSPCVEIHFQELSQILRSLSASQWLWGSPCHPGLLTYSTNPAGGPGHIAVALFICHRSVVLFI